jgi:hypothetical protein
LQRADRWDTKEQTMAHTTRRIVRTLAAVAVAGSALALAGGSAQAQGADVTTERFTASDTIDFIDPCTGGSTALNITFKGTFHEVARPNGTGMFINNINGYATEVPGDPSVKSQSVHFTAVTVGAAGSNVAFTDILNAEGRGADGTRISVHALFHITTNALDVVTVEVDRAVCP